MLHQETQLRTEDGNQGWQLSQSREEPLGYLSVPDYSIRPSLYLIKKQSRSEDQLEDAKVDNE